jgi:hypothetical protein
VYFSSKDSAGDRCCHFFFSKFTVTVDVVNWCIELKVINCYKDIRGHPKYTKLTVVLVIHQN